ncbi:MAG: carboxypeptidase regulatory-like domain-containing protein [Actinobacteria bacterium]|nr:MAG: carboxypeptidase regulatory-like domain-containing protein [Actinomycetota bacterium]
MRRTLATALLLALIACGRTSGPASTSGIFGTVTAGPTCPVERVGSPCPPAPWVGTVRATDDAGHPTETTTDENGDYTLTLEPGSYEVVAVTDGGPPTGQPVAIDVQAGHPIRVDLTVDTGIR